jgi:hypothetical protein
LLFLPGFLSVLGIMQAKKKKKKTIVIHTTQPRAVRLRRGKVWLATYEGKNLIRGYAGKYRVDLLTAISELRMLGVEIKAEYEQAVRQSIAQQIEQKRKKKEQEFAVDEFDSISEYQDWDFAFIAGYTSGGAPYGIRWEDMPEEGEMEY